MIHRSLFIAVLLIAAIRLAAIDAAISYATFQSPDRAYLELYLRVNGATVAFASRQDSLQQAGADVLLQYYQDGEIRLADRFRMTSPLTTEPVDFIALQRYPLSPGTYELVLEISDAAAPDNKKRYRTTVEIRFEKQQLSQSDISLLADLQPDTGEGPFIRHGFRAEPQPDRFYGADADRLYFYHEIYHSDREIGQDFVVTYAIESAQPENPDRLMERHRRQSAQPIIGLYGQLDIGDLPSGHYQLVVELRDRNKQLLSRSTSYFQRSNPGLWQRESWLASFDPANTFIGKIPADSLAYCLRALTPILPPTEMETINWLLKQRDERSQRTFLWRFWSERSGGQALSAYQDYMRIVRAVDQQFQSGFRYGFETDRGYVYLKYGRPTEIESRENEPSAPPYEIWTYDQLPATQQSNVRFVFYNPSLSPGDYRLLHATARGELQQPQWQRILYRNAPGETQDDDFLEGTEVIDNFHRSSRRLFGEGG